MGLSLNCITCLAPLRALIAETRSVTRNRDLVILVGGHVFLESPELVAAVGADGTAPDAEAAVRLARSLLPPILCDPSHAIPRRQSERTSW